MTGLKKMLLQEQERLENHSLQNEKAVGKRTPGGRCDCQDVRKWIQYLHCMPGCGGKGEYIPKSECDRVRSLAQKSYDEKVVRLAEKRLSQIKKIVRDYDEEEMEKIFWREHRERQKWIEPVEIVWEKQLEEWHS